MTSDDSHGSFEDPFIEEVRRLKRSAFARSGDDLARHVERLRELERAHPGGVLPPPPQQTPDAAA